jgi:ABC-type nitrate/sulfonate/bicarbonate transport system substrate-binding protein
MFAGKLFLCAGCNALAEKADAELVQANARALEQSRQWLEQHIMSGGLLKGGTGEGKT